MDLPSSKLLMKRPSIFEILNEEKLSEVVKPAIFKFFKVIGVHFVQLRSLERYFDECFLAFSLVLQGFHLKYYDASFTEYLYGMKRISSKDNGQNTRPQWIRSVFVVVILPYIMKKFDDYRKFRLSSRANTKRSFISKVLCGAVILKPIFSLICLGMRLAYILLLCSAHSPFIKLAGVQLSKLSAAKGISIAENTSGIDNIFSFKSRKYMISFLSLVSQMFGYTLMCWQLLDFTRDADLAFIDTPSTRNNSIIPPAPQQLLRKGNSTSAKCPICGKKQIQRTVLISSGYIFCYSCIRSYVAERGMCPVTSLPADISDLTFLRC